jgi:ACS family tartrate transporter-like MFS transporter
MIGQVEKRTVHKAAWRLLPLLLAAYFVAFLNRVNIGFADGMQGDLGLNATAFGLGAGVFFIGYFLFEVPSNLLLHKYGARRWIARIMFTWGLLSMAMAFVRGHTSFMVLRFFLGVAEAGLFPGIILYITYWFPAAYRGRMTALFMVAIPLSLVIGGPVSNWIMAPMAGMLGLKAWQWLFILEALPTVLLSGVVLCCLTDRPKDARWLSAEERAWLEGELDRESRAIGGAHGKEVWRALLDPRVLLLSYIYLANITTNLGIAFFLPKIIKDLGASGVAANYISSIPYVVGVVGILLFGELSDRFRGRRKELVVVALCLSALGLAGAGAVGASYASVALIAVATIGIYGAKGPFWPLPSMFLTGAAAAGGIGLINSIGNLGGFVGPYAMGWIRDATGSYSAALYMIAALALSGVFATFFLKNPSPASSPNRASKGATEPVLSSKESA